MADCEQQPGPAPPPDQLVMDLINAHRRSKIMFAVVDLGIIDLLMQAAPASLPAPAIAQAIAVTAQRPHATKNETGDPETAAAAPHPCTPEAVSALSRLLQAGVELGILACSPRAPCSPPTYSLTPVSEEYLATSSPRSLAGYVIHCNRLVYPLFQHLETCVLTGGNAWQEEFGMPSSQVFQNLYQSEEGLLRFMKGMHSFAALSARQVLTAFDLSCFHEAVDLGGATGAFMSVLASLHPQCHCTVVDLPHVIQAAERHFSQPPFIEDPDSLHGRLSWLALDFLEAADGSPAAAEKLPKADLYVLTRILHDWDEERCLKLLRFIHGRMAPGSALLIGEMLMAGPGEDGTAGQGAVLQDINMLVQTHGRERDAQGYFDLLARAGFEPEKMRSKRTGVYLDAVLAER